jgi:hypothetical protein
VTGCAYRQHQTEVLLQQGLHCLLHLAVGLLYNVKPLLQLTVLYACRQGWCGLITVFEFSSMQHLLYALT